MPLLELSGVTKRVHAADGTELQILHGVNLVVEAGQRVSIVGRSGSGKSTLLNIVGLLDAPTDGSVVFDGVVTNRLGQARRDRLRGDTIGFVFQQFNLLQRRTAVENVAMPLGYASGSDFWRRRELAAEMLERVGLGHRLDATPDRLSGGEQQRVAIARALVRKPRLILADEPTGALDVETGEVVMQLLDEITTETGATVVTITHDAGIAQRAERRLRLIDGVLDEESTPSAALVGAGAGGVDVARPTT